MADLARHNAAPSGSENIGDVLASIRRLIAQDEANGLSETTARRLGALHQRGDKAPVADLRPTQTSPTAADAPLVLGSVDFIGPVQPAHAAIAMPEAETGPTHAMAKPEISTTSTTPEMESLLSIPSFADAEAKEQEDSAALEEILTTIIHEQVDSMIQQAQATTAPTQLHPALAENTALSSEEPRNLFLMEDEEFVMPDTPLRGMIRDTVVQELQGEFGSQFSRKLRNLVRAEIAIALKAAIKG